MCAAGGEGDAVAADSWLDVDVVGGAADVDGAEGVGVGVVGDEAESVAGAVDAAGAAVGVQGGGDAGAADAGASEVCDL